MNRSLHASITATLLLCANSAWAVFPAGNPIDATIPTASWTVEVEDVLTIPNSSGSAPRMEDLVFGGEPGMAYVIDQRGPIWSFDPSDANPTPTLFLDVYSTVSGGNINNQTGVRGMAFHPDFNNPAADGYRKFYTAISRNAFSPPDSDPASTVFFPAPNSVNHDSIVAEWTVDGSGDVIPTSFRQIVGVGQRFDDHNIGQIAFNPNAQPGDADYGNLYIAMGDGGNNFPAIPIDPNNNGQSLDRPHGSIMRINPLVDGTNPYTIPSDNPFRVSDQLDVARNTMWAYGLRNPHKFTFDTVSGKMLIADIGQANVEEVNLGAAGANYGWDETEGTFATTGSFSGSNNIVDDLPASHTTDDFTYPVAQYDHDLDNNGFIDHLFAIAGGPVYRGDDVPQLAGRYLFGDFSEENVLYAVGVDDLVQREDFSDLENLNGGHLAPFEQLRLTRNGVETSLIDIIRTASGNPGQNRSDLRLAQGPDGEVYLLNKRDGVVRRLAAVDGLLAGDFNEDGVVDAADYTVWRDNLGDRYSQSDFDVWEANYGESLASLGQSDGRPSGVPEPSGLLLVVAAAYGAATGRRR